MAPITNITRILVTGFGLYGNLTKNPSWEIASRLPSQLPNSVEIIVYPSALPVAYRPVIDTVPALIETNKPDLVLSMGVAEGRHYFAVEQTSAKGPYKGLTQSENDALWKDQPTRLSTDLNLPDVVAKWQQLTSSTRFPSRRGTYDSGEEKRGVAAGSLADVRLSDDVMKIAGAVNKTDVRWSGNAGDYLCGFIYFMDLVEMGKLGKRNVAFVHSPLLAGEEEYATGVEIVIALIQAMVASWRAGNV